MRGSGISHLYASWFASVDEARKIMKKGVFRVCVEITTEEQAKGETIVEYSRLFGRIV